MAAPLPTMGEVIAFLEAHGLNNTLSALRAEHGDERSETARDQAAQSSGASSASAAAARRLQRAQARLVRLPSWRDDQPSPATVPLAEPAAEPVMEAPNEAEDPVQLHLAPAIAPSSTTNTDEEDDTDCSICMSVPRAVRLRPCGHASSCTLCTLRMMSSQRLSCPICKQRAQTLEWVRPNTARYSAPDVIVARRPPALGRLSTFDATPVADGLSIADFLRAACHLCDDDPQAPSHSFASDAEHVDEVRTAARTLLSEFWDGCPRLWTWAVRHMLWRASSEGDDGEDDDPPGEEEPMRITRLRAFLHQYTSLELHAAAGADEALFYTDIHTAVQPLEQPPARDPEAARAAEGRLLQLLEPVNVRALSGGGEMAPDVTPLIRLIADGDVDAVRRYIDELDEPMPADTAGYALVIQDRVHATDSLGYNALMHAAAEGTPAHADILQLLLAHSPNVNLFDRMGATALHIAVTGGSTPEAITALLGVADLDVNHFDEAGETPLHRAATGSPQALRLLLGHPEVDVNLMPPAGSQQTPLMRAAEIGHVDCLEALLADPRVDVNAQSGGQGNTALMYAANSNHADAITALLNAAPRPPGPRGPLSAIHVSGAGYAPVNGAFVRDGYYDHAPLYKNGDIWLFRARGGGEVAASDALYWLIAMKPQSTNRSHDEFYRVRSSASQPPLSGAWSALGAGRAPLPSFEAVYKYELVTCDTDSPGVVDVNLANYPGGTPLMYAATQNHVQAVGALLASPALDVNMTSGASGLTALHHACMDGNADAIGVLLQDTRLDVNCVSAEGETPLMIAEERGHAAACDALHSHPKLDHRAGVSRIVKAVAAEAIANVVAAASPLLRAASKGDAGGLSALLAARTNVDDADAAAATADTDRPPTPSAVSLEVDADVMDLDGHTPLMLAAAAGHVGVVDVLLRATGAACELIEVSNAHIDAIMLLPQVDVNAGSRQAGDTALHLAARAAKPDTVRALLASGLCDTGACNYALATALDVAKDLIRGAENPSTEASTCIHLLEEARSQEMALPREEGALARPVSRNGSRSSGSNSPEAPSWTGDFRVREVPVRWMVPVPAAVSHSRAGANTAPAPTGGQRPRMLRSGSFSSSSDGESGNLADIRGSTPLTSARGARHAPRRTDLDGPMAIAVDSISLNLARMADGGSGSDSDSTLTI